MLVCSLEEVTHEEYGSEALDCHHPSAWEEENSAIPSPGVTYQGPGRSATRSPEVVHPTNSFGSGHEAWGEAEVFPGGALGYSSTIFMARHED